MVFCSHPIYQRWRLGRGRLASRQDPYFAAFVFPLLDCSKEDQNLPPAGAAGLRRDSVVWSGGHHQGAAAEELPRQLPMENSPQRSNWSRRDRTMLRLTSLAQVF